MEFSWSQDVARQGLGSLGITLCSRLLGTAQNFLTNQPAGGDCIQYLVPTAVNPHAAYVGTTLSKLPGHPHFPYGYDVEPNVPL